MSDTPKTDHAAFQILSPLQSGPRDVVHADLARDLERALAAAQRQREEARAERDHWKRAREDAIAGGEILMRERDTLRARVAELTAMAGMLDAVVQGAQEEFVRVPYGASHEDVEQINDWHKMARDARAILAQSSEETK